jgi:hypothetical protein
MEESPTASDTKRLCIEARQALREAYGLHPGELSSIEQALVKSLSKLILAVDRSVQGGTGFSLLVCPSWRIPLRQSSHHWMS